MRMKMSQTSQWQARKTGQSILKFYFDLKNNRRVSQANGKFGKSPGQSKLNPIFHLKIINKRCEAR